MNSFTPPAIGHGRPGRGRGPVSSVAGGGGRSPWSRAAEAAAGGQPRGGRGRWPKNLGCLGFSGPKGPKTLGFSQHSGNMRFSTAPMALSAAWGVSLGGSWSLEAHRWMGWEYFPVAQNRVWTGFGQVGPRKIWPPLDFGRRESTHASTPDGLLERKMAVFDSQRSLES